MLSPMEAEITSSGDSSDIFFDAFDAFFTPNLAETITTPTSSASSTHGRIENQQENEGTATSLREGSSTSLHLRRRRASSHFTVPHHRSDAIGSSYRSRASIETPSARERRSNLLHDVKERGNSGGTSTSTLTSVQNVAGSDLGQETSRWREEALASVNESPPQSLLISLADLVIKAIFFQINILIKCSTLPIWLTYNSLLFVANPLGKLRCTIDGTKRKMIWVFKVVLDCFSPFIPEMLKREHWICQLAGRLFWGCLWSFYVGIVLFGLLILGCLCAKLLMSRIVEKPLQMTRNINFDYTKASPNALVQLMPCDGAGCSLEFDEKDKTFKSVIGRAIPPNHKLHLTISLTLPESDYNRNLGVFQVRVEFLSIYGKITSSLSKPCMLRFKSSPIRIMETFIKSGPLLAGYSSESQVVDLVLSGFTEGPEPTMCVRIILEQRAEYRPGAGIPEIYSASLKLKSELPLLKRVIWNWRRTLLVWSALSFFIWEVLIVLVCCRTVLFPCRRQIDVVSTNSSHPVVSNTP